MANTVVKIGKMASTNVDAYLKAVVFATDVENGAHVVLGDAIAGDLNTYNAATPTDVTTQQVLIIEAPVLVEIEGLRVDIQDPRKFINPAGRVLRARDLKVGDDLTMTIDGFSAAPTVGEYAVPVNGSTKLSPASDLDGGGSTLVYKVVSKTSISAGQDRIEAYKLLVVKA